LQFPFSQDRPCQPHFRDLVKAESGEKLQLDKPRRVSFGVLSISQPAKTGCRGEIPRFSGFYACFLEMTLGMLLR
jgi:hypothetical protein